MILGLVCLCPAFLEYPDLVRNCVDFRTCNTQSFLTGERYEIIVTAGACIPVTDVFTRVGAGGLVSERLTE